MFLKVFLTIFVDNQHIFGDLLSFIIFTLHAFNVIWILDYQFKIHYIVLLPTSLF